MIQYSKRQRNRQLAALLGYMGLYILIVEFGRIWLCNFHLRHNTQPLLGDIALFDYHKFFEF